VATAVLVSAPSLAPTAASLVPVYPYAVFAGGLLLAWRFHHMRLIFALLVIAAAAGALLQWAAGDLALDDTGRIVINMLGILLPLNLAVLAWIPDSGVRGPRGGIALAVLAVQALVVALLAKPEALAGAAILRRAFVDPRLVRWTGLEQSALAAFALGFGLVAARFVRRPSPFESGLTWAVVAAFFALSTPRTPLASIIYFATAGLILVISLIETSHAMAYTDELTGLPTRRALTETLDRLAAPYTVAMVDIDNFKQFNDTHGHDVGDQLLRMVGATLGKTSGGGRAFRYGGEEFAVIFARTPLTQALPHLESLRQAVERTGFTLRGPDRPARKPKQPRADSRGRGRVAVTVSVGAADADRRTTRAMDVIRAADAALYRAKEAGRNRIET
jgi:diguanylate cyclase (GGDEF)-like protein